MEETGLQESEADKPTPDDPIQAISVDRIDAKPFDQGEQRGLRNVPPDYSSPVQVTQLSAIVPGSSRSRSIPLTDPEAAPHGVKHKRSQSIISESGEPEMDPGSSRATESQEYLAFKTSQKREPKPQGAQTAAKSKPPGPTRGMITLRDGDSLLGGTLGMSYSFSPKYLKPFTCSHSMGKDGYV
jgi:hypothetical protein